MNSFNQQIQNYSKELQKTHYPHTETELDKVILNTIHEGSLIEHSETFPPQYNSPIPTARLIAMAATILMPIIISFTMLIMNIHDRKNIRTIDIDGQQIIFGCNKGCDPEEVLDNFKTIIK